uniref:Uncharacterized protein n=1 Tax=Pipistrellus kuhlii TaxID=59472 RepID=A0A7J7YWS4_PIPKU|nr:hypothetical protein mPipKuh1_009875 [Pipistrellus kuhlii]
MSSLVKDYFARQQNLSPDKIFSVIVAPGKIVQIMEQNDLASNDTTVDTLSGDMKEEEVRLHHGASSNGYLSHIFRHMAKEQFNENVGVLTYHTLRNKDWQEVTLERDGEVLLLFEAAVAFGTSRSGPEAVEGQVLLPLRGGPGLGWGCLSGRGQAQGQHTTGKEVLSQLELCPAHLILKFPEKFSVNDKYYLSVVGIRDRQCL